MSDDPIVIHAEPHSGVERRAGNDRRALVTALESPSPDISPPPPELEAPKGMRASALDALRGLFLISMTLGFTIDRLDFPLWMYHRQSPPPDYSIVSIPGISWRDLAYGAFLFTMAAALPLTLTKRIESGETEIGLGVASVKRYLLLLFFALLVAHANTFFLGYTQPARVLAVVGFVLMALVYTRRRPDWNERTFNVVNRIGWVLAIAFLVLTPRLLGQTFKFENADEIITGLAFAALVGSLVWYFTRNNLVARLGVLALAVALFLSAQADGWVSAWWDSSAVEWAFAPNKLALLLVVIPGTIAGDVILRWMHTAKDPGAVPAWNSGRAIALLGLAVAMVPVVVVGLYQRQVLLTTQIAVALVIAGLFLTMNPRSPDERMLRSLFLWAATWLVIGLVLDPFEGGIKKAPETLSYFFTVTGLTMMLLVALTVITEALAKRRAVSALIDVGHNPLLTYVIYTVLINSVFEMIPPLRGVLRASQGEAMLRSVVEVVAVVLLVRLASRRRIYWRT